MPSRVLLISRSRMPGRSEQPSDLGFWMCICLDERLIFFAKENATSAHGADFIVIFCACKNLAHTQVNPPGALMAFSPNVRRHLDSRLLIFYSFVHMSYISFSAALLSFFRSLAAFVTSITNVCDARGDVFGGCFASRPTRRALSLRCTAGLVKVHISAGDQTCF